MRIILDDYDFTNYLWKPAPEQLLLAEDEVHVWRASLDCGASTINLLSEYLNPEEHERAKRFYFQDNRENFSVARGILRDVLSRYIHTPPTEINFSYNEYGKPFMAEEVGDRPLRFNLSHSCGLGLYAIVVNRDVGVDVEFVRNDLAYMEIVECFFSHKESKILRELPKEQQLIAFYNCWTRKEAFIKALGKGLSYPLDQFSVAAAPEKPVHLLDMEIKSVEGLRFSLVELFPGNSYIAAMAVEGRISTIHYWDWNIISNK